jgi:hypothetical protein
MVPLRLKTALLGAAILCLGLVAIAQAEVAQRGDLRVSFDGKLSPHALPRQGVAPVAVTVGGHITTTDGASPPQLQRITIAINRHGRLDFRGLPVCKLADIQPASTVEALRSCRASRIGEGSFSANVAIPTQAPFPSKGKVVAFNGRQHGKPVILAHVYGIEPVPTSYTLPFSIDHAKGTFATTLTASLPQTTGEWGFVTGVEMTLQRRFRYRGKPRSYVSASCTAPPGFPGATFPLARAGFAFAGPTMLTLTLTRSCKVTG